MRLSVVLCRLGYVGVLFCSLFSPATGCAADRPNIVYILANDLGWKDTGFHGGTLQTPNLDRLARSGAVLNSFYCQPFSTQTRAALMTGRYPMRYGLQTASISDSSQFGLPADEYSLAQSLKLAGYSTAYIGGWHLGHAKPEFRPAPHGFDYFYGSLVGHNGYFLTQSAKIDWYRNGHALKEEGYVTALLAKDAARLIGKRDAAQPLFLVLSFMAPAAPFGASQDQLDKYRSIEDPARRRYAAAVTALDDAIGEVISALKNRNMLENTLIIFHSDNGGAMPTRYPTGDADVDEFAADNGNFREGRGSLYEGGVRVTALASWPGRIKPGSIVTDMLHVTDMYSTLLTLAGGLRPQRDKLDGLDVWTTLAEGRPSPRKEVLVNVEDFRGAIRVGERPLGV